MISSEIAAPAPIAAPMIETRQLDARTGGTTRSTAAAIEAEPAQGAMLITGSLILLQFADGVLTHLGVSRYGVGVEGNPFLRSLMMQFGNVPTLGFIKLTAILFILALSYYARRLPWINNAMGAISCVYLFAAVLPWTYVLFISDWL